MNKVRIGIICPSEIAFRRFMPAVQLCDDVEYVGVASADQREWFGENIEGDMAVIEQEHQKAMKFQETYGGEVFNSYKELLYSDKIDAVYLPLPPALHFKWAQKAIQQGKNIFLEKPSTTSYDDSLRIIKLAKKSNVAVHENYMFTFHEQISTIKSLIKSGDLGDVRLYRIAFGFPKRANNDFRYNKALGGGALLDCGGYTLKLAYELLGETAHICCSQLNYLETNEVDMYGSATMVNDDGLVAQLAFGMDNSYKCELEIWGSKGTLFTSRIMTAPAGFVPTAQIKRATEAYEIELPVDDTFKKSIEYFVRCVKDADTRLNSYSKILKQAELVEQMKGESHGRD